MRPDGHPFGRFARRAFLQGAGGAISAAYLSAGITRAPGKVPVYGALCFDDKSGQLTGLYDSNSHVMYELASWRFEIVLKGATLRSEESQKTELEFTESGARVSYAFGEYRVSLLAMKTEVADFGEYRLEVERAGGAALYVKAVTQGDFAFREPFEELIEHKDSSILRTPINVFLRSPSGGAILGLTYPYQQICLGSGRRRVKFEYEVESAIASGDKFVSETLFAGTYIFSGLGIYKPVGRTPYRFITPDPEERDLGEVWAMQKYVRAKLPYFTAKSKRQTSLLLNSWSANLQIPNLPPAMDLMTQLMVSQIGTKETYFGVVEHTAETSRLENLPDHYRVPFSDDAKEMIEYAKERGVTLATFVLPCRPFRTEWEWRDQNGQPSMYGEIRSICFACREAAEFALELWDKMIQDSGSDRFAFDGRFMTSFSEIDVFGGPIGPMPCYATNHGHEPGHNFYQDYRNVQFILKELRRRNPGIFLEIYWGCKRGYPWALMELNGCENYYEAQCAQDDRMQVWYNQNYRFLPNYKNWAQIRGYNSAELEKEILSSISITSHYQVGAAVKLLEHSGNQEFFKFWMEWAETNLDYLRVKRDLFGQPWAIPLDGSAHILGDRGFIFLFNEAGEDHAGLIPLNEWIGLKSGRTFDVEQIYPDARNLAANVKRGEKVLLPVEASRMSVVEIRPSSATAAIPERIVWSSLGDAKVTMRDKELAIEELKGFEGETREIVLSLRKEIPEKLVVNGIPVEFAIVERALFASVEFEVPATSRVMDVRTIWDGANAASQIDGGMLLKGPIALRSKKRLASGIYEFTLECNFDRGGVFVKSDAELQEGLLAAAMFDAYPPTYGNLAFWDVRFDQFPITWTLGESLKKGGRYRFRLESFGGRQVYSVRAVENGTVLAGPLRYRVRDLSESGFFGVRIQGGSATVCDFRFAESRLTNEFTAKKPNAAEFISAAFHARSDTKQFGQRAATNARWPFGTDVARDFEYAKKCPE